MAGLYVLFTQMTLSHANHVEAMLVMSQLPSGKVQ